MNNARTNGLGRAAVLAGCVTTATALATARVPNAARGESQQAAPTASAADADRWTWISADGRTLRPKDAADAKELYQMRLGQRSWRTYASDEPLELIGMLATHQRWVGVLPLSDGQVSAINRLDHVLRETIALGRYADADHSADDVATYEAYLAQRQQRRRAAIDHAQRMVMTGLLTPAQAAFVWQRWSTARRPVFSLYNEQVREMLALTPAQTSQILHIGEKYRSELVNREALQVLTPAQQATWSRLRAERSLPAAEAPNLPASRELAPDAAWPDLAELSPVFRVLTDKSQWPRALSGYQQRLVDDLAEATRDGVLWIGLREEAVGGKDATAGDAGRTAADSIAAARAAFVKQAEQVALVGILTEHQAERVSALVQGK